MRRNARLAEPGFGSRRSPIMGEFGFSPNSALGLGFGFGFDFTPGFAPVLEGGLEAALIAALDVADFEGGCVPEFNPEEKFLCGTDEPFLGAGCFGQTMVTPERYLRH